jgi:hypothetical protein
MNMMVGQITVEDIHVLLDQPLDLLATWLSLPKAVAFHFAVADLLSAADVIAENIVLVVAVVVALDVISIVFALLTVASDVADSFLSVEDVVAAEAIDARQTAVVVGTKHSAVAAVMLHEVM